MSESKKSLLSPGELKPLCQIATPIGMLGYGFDEEEFDAALERLMSIPVPTAIILDSGSTDGGPSKLATGVMSCPHSSYKRDLTKLIKAVLKYRVPLLISSAGGGSNAQVDIIVDIIQEILLSFSKTLNIVALYSEVLKSTILKRLDSGGITGCGPVVPLLTPENVSDAPTIVAQMGPEPLLAAMIANPSFDIIIAGRAYDPAPYIAYCAYLSLRNSSSEFESLDRNVLGGFVHMGKIMECGGICATPKSRGAIATVYTNGAFDICPTDLKAKCTMLSVAAHTLYEKTRPDILHGPGGWLDLTGTTYRQLQDGVSVRARGATFHFSRDTEEPYTVKLEGARLTGFRTLFIGSFNDTILIEQLPKFLETGRTYVSQQHPPSGGQWRFDWHLTGLEDPTVIPKKVFIVGEILAESQELANGVAHSARIYCVHAPYPSQKGTSGNFAMGIGGKLELPVGECAEFCIYHLMDLKHGEEGAREVNAANAVGNSGPLFTWKKVFANDTSYIQDRGSSGEKNPFNVQDEKPAESDSRALGINTSLLTLRDIAKVIRSKNAGPYEVTLDVMFENPHVYQAVKKSGILSPETIVKLYDLASVDEIVWCGFFDQALAFKATLPRRRGGKVICSGGYMEDDVHGSQQYMPLMEMKLSEGLIGELERLRIESDPAEVK